MPTYEYRCKNCGHQFEVVQSFSDAALTECALCEGPLRKVFSPVGVVLKGSGFYRTDSRSAGNGKRKAKADATAGSSSESGSDSGSGSTTKTAAGSSGGDSTSSSSSSSSSSSTSTTSD
jgi:putative FmdB family regulatory protein